MRAIAALPVPLPSARHCSVYQTGVTLKTVNSITGIVRSWAADNYMDTKKSMNFSGINIELLTSEMSRIHLYLFERKRSFIFPQYSAS